MSKKSILIIFLLLGLYSPTSCAQLTRSQYKSITEGKDASVGVAVVCGKMKSAFRNDIHYPLMSVVKFPVAVCALKKMECEGDSVDRMVTLSPNQLHDGTYCPLRSEHPDGWAMVSIRQILDYALRLSDNNACDWLIDYCGGIERVDTFVRSLGIKGFKLTQTEAQMHEDIFRCYLNSAHPMDVANLFEKVFSGGVISKDHRSLIEQSMTKTATGNNKLKAGFPRTLAFVHKTGHSDRYIKPTDSGASAFGRMVGDCDAGFLILPDGRKCFVVVLIKDSALSDGGNEQIFQSIARGISQNLKLNE